MFIFTLKYKKKYFKILDLRKFFYLSKQGFNARKKSIQYCSMKINDIDIGFNAYQKLSYKDFPVRPRF